MQANMPPAPLRRSTHADQTGAAPAGAGHSEAFNAAALDSNTLLQGHKAVAINHNGAVYRLQATKLGKLILTK